MEIRLDMKMENTVVEDVDEKDVTTEISAD